MSAERGVRISRNTVQSLCSPCGPLTETSPPCTASLICDSSRAASPPTAALHAVTEYTSLSHPCTCTPPFSTPWTPTPPPHGAGPRRAPFPPGEAAGEEEAAGELATPVGGATSA